MTLAPRDFRALHESTGTRDPCQRHHVPAPRAGPGEARAVGSEELRGLVSRRGRRESQPAERRPARTGSRSQISDARASADWLGSRIGPRGIRCPLPKPMLPSTTTMSRSRSRRRCWRPSSSSAISAPDSLARRAELRPIRTDPDGDRGTTGGNQDRLVSCDLGRRKRRGIERHDSRSSDVRSHG